MTRPALYAGVTLVVFGAFVSLGAGGVVGALATALALVGLGIVLEANR